MKQKKMHFSLRLLWEVIQLFKMIWIYSQKSVVLVTDREPYSQAIRLGSSAN